MGGFSVWMEAEKTGVYSKNRISIWISRGTETAGVRCVSYHLSWKKSFYSGTNRCREDYFDDISCGKSSWGKLGGMLYMKYGIYIFKGVGVLINNQWIYCKKLEL